MRDGIVCLVIKGNLVSDDIRDELLVVAYRMILTHEKKCKIKTEECEGVVRTTFQHQSLVDIYGVVFTAEIETNRGKLDLTYLVRDRDLRGIEESEYGAWQPLEEWNESIVPEEMRPNPLRRARNSYKNN